MSTIVIAVIAAFVAAGAALGAVGHHVRKHPLETFVKTTRIALRKAGMTRHELTAGGSRVVYFTGGQGPRTLVLVHGVNDQAGTWAGVVPALARRFRVVAIDLPGHGESEPAMGPLPMKLMLDALSSVIDRQSPDQPVILLGNSMGGWVSILYAAEWPARVAHLVLEDASGMAWDISNVPMFPRTREEALKLLHMVHGPDAKIPEYLVDAVLHQAASLPQARVIQAGILDWLVDTRLEKLTMPVTLIWGAHDGLLPLDYAHALNEKIHGSTLHVIDTAAHIPHRQTPSEFNNVLEAALR